MLSSWDVRNRLGTQFHWDWFGGPAWDRREELLFALRGAGIQHLRTTGFADDVPELGAEFGWEITVDHVHDWLKELADAGVSFLFSAGEPVAAGQFDHKHGRPQDIITAIAQRYADACVGIELPNEYDNPSATSPDIIQPWADTLRSFSEQVGFMWKGNPTVGHLPVVGPSLVWDSSAYTLGSLQHCADAKNAHGYSGNKVWTIGDAQGQKTRLNPVHGSLARTWMTEYGPSYRNPAPGNWPVLNEQQGAIVGVKQYLTALHEDYERVYPYALLDPQEGFGLLRDDLSPRPIYEAFKKLMSLCDTSKPTAAAPPALNWSFPGRPADSRALVAWKANGHYLVSIWRECPLGSSAVACSVSFPDKTHLVSTDLISGSADCPKDEAGGFTYDIVLGDDPLVLEVS